MTAPYDPDADRRRHAAVLVISCGMTAAQLRGFAQKPGNPYADRDAELAEEVEALTAAGMTKRSARQERARERKAAP
jgi:predicted kinase